MVSSNLEKLLISALPFGTGNDTGRSLGWGRTEGRYATDLELIAQQLVEGKRDKLALWEIEVFADEVFDIKLMN